MKIVYILSGTGTLGGATKSFINMLNHIVECGNSVLVVTPNKDGIYTVLTNRGIPTVFLPYYFNAKPEKRLKSVLANPVKRILNRYSASRLKHLCRKFRPDIIHSNTSVNNIGYLVAKWLDLPHVWHIREYGDKDFNMEIRHLNQRLTERNNYSIAITKDIARHRNVLGTANNRVIYNGIINQQQEIPIGPKENYFLYAGRIEKAKGIEDCIDAFIAFKTESKKDIQLLIAGNPTTDGQHIKSDLIKRINIAGLTNDVHWLGGRDDINILMSKALATIVPSFFEGFGRVMPEAMSVGCLVIGRDTGGTKEQFDNGVEFTGQEIGLRFKTVDELKNHLTAIAKNGLRHYQPMVQRGFLTVNNLYSIEEYGKHIFEFYKYVLNQ